MNEFLELKGNMKFLLAIVFLVPFSLHADNTPVTVKVEPIKVGAHSYYVQGHPGAASSANQGFMSNAGFVITPAGVVVFDSLGSPPLGDELIKAIAKLTPLPIKLVIVSHFHADHVYGLQSFKARGAKIWAHERGKEYLASDIAKARLAQRREDLFPWVDENTRLIQPDLWLKGDVTFQLGGVNFVLYYVGPAHSPEDIAMLVKEDGVLYSGDLIFKGRVPFVGDADTKMWLQALNKLLPLQPKYLIPGHGSVSNTPAKDLALTRDYLTYVRAEMGKAVENFVPFEDAYAKTNWKKFSGLPAFKDANRANAYNTYLLLEKESLK